MVIVKRMVFCLVLFFAGCTAVPEETAVSDGFSYRGMAGLPDGFDAQGHRGARGLLPENTLPSFEASLDLGVTTLELDLHFSQDGHVMIWHDPIIDNEKCRLPDGTPNDTPDPRNPIRRIFISQQPAEVIQRYQCDLNPDEDRFPNQTAQAMPLAGNNYHIPTLTELFEFVDAYAQNENKTELQRMNAAQVQFNIETKRVPDSPENIGDGFTGGEAGPFELAILTLVESYGLENRVIIQSFDHRSLQTIRAINSDIRLAALTTRGADNVKVYNGYGFDIWSPRASDLTPELLEEAQSLGLLVIPWTINDTAEMATLIEMGVDGIITDRPDLLLQQ